MKLRKGDKIHFISRNETEIIIKVSNDRFTSDIVTDKKTYSTDFIQRWIDFGFVKVLDKSGLEK